MAIVSAEYSPGPWRHEGYMIRDRRGQEIAAVGPGGSFEGTLDHGNAALIASAPTLAADLAEARRLIAWALRMMGALGAEYSLRRSPDDIAELKCARAFLARVDTLKGDDRG